MKSVPQQSWTSAQAISYFLSSAVVAAAEAAGWQGPLFFRPAQAQTNPLIWEVSASHYTEGCRYSHHSTGLISPFYINKRLWGATATSSLPHLICHLPQTSFTLFVFPSFSSTLPHFFPTIISYFFPGCPEWRMIESAEDAWASTISSAAQNVDRAVQ